MFNAKLIIFYNISKTRLKAYINNIIYYFANYLYKVCILFKNFLHYNIFIKPIKTYFNYSNIGLLGQFLKLLIINRSFKAVHLV